MKISWPFLKLQHAEGVFTQQFMFPQTAYIGSQAHYNDEENI